MFASLRAVLRVNNSLVHFVYISPVFSCRVTYIGVNYVHG